jgi:UDP-3-O-[3-hydroxymyristoyl] glucosamine N-acyltransferase
MQDDVEVHAMTEVIIHGTGKLAQMVGLLMRDGSDHTLAGFTADERYCTSSELQSVPLVPFGRVEETFPPDRYGMLTVLGGLGGPEARIELFDGARAKGYRHVNFVHPTVVIEGTVEMGVNNVVFPYTVLGFDGRMGDDNVLREKVYLGHEFRLGHHNFIGVGCTIGGELEMADSCYIAMGTTVTNNITIGHRTVVGIGSLVLKDPEPESTNHGRPARRVR